jgi:hypothetical protein
LEAARHAGLSQYLQRLPLERVMRTGDGHPLGKVPMVGSVWWSSSTT